MNIFKYILILILIIPLASAYNLSGHVQNTLEYPVYQARVDFNGSHVFTDSNGYYNFSNISSGNYTFLCRYIAASIGHGHFANYTKNISISGDKKKDILSKLVLE